jgi:hypothetical protein
MPVQVYDSLNGCAETIIQLSFLVFFFGAGHPSQQWSGFECVQ